MHKQFAVVLGLMVLVSPAFAQVAPKGDPKPANITDVKAELKKEVIEGIKEHNHLPRKFPNYAIRNHVTLDPKVVIRNLQSKTDSRPFVDAYVKWQLTSFLPPESLFNLRDANKIMAAAPSYTAPAPPILPSLDGGGGVMNIRAAVATSNGLDTFTLPGNAGTPAGQIQLPNINVLQVKTSVPIFGGPVSRPSGGITDRELVSRIRKGFVNFAENRKQVDLANQVVGNYRKEIYDRIDEKHAYLKVASVLDDLAGRLSVADANTDTAIDYAVQMTQSLKPDALKATEKKKLKAYLYQLSTIQRIRIENIKFDGKVPTYDFDTEGVQLPDEARRSIALKLR